MLRKHLLCGAAAGLLFMSPAMAQEIEPPVTMDEEPEMGLEEPDPGADGDIGTAQTGTGPEAVGQTDPMVTDPPAPAESPADPAQDAPLPPANEELTVEGDPPATTPTDPTVPTPADPQPGVPADPPPATPTDPAVPADPPPATPTDPAVPADSAAPAGTGAAPTTGVAPQPGSGFSSDPMPITASPGADVDGAAELLRSEGFTNLTVKSSDPDNGMYEFRANSPDGAIVVVQIDVNHGRYWVHPGH